MCLVVAYCSHFKSDKVFMLCTDCVVMLRFNLQRKCLWLAYFGNQCVLDFSTIRLQFLNIMSAFIYLLWAFVSGLVFDKFIAVQVQNSNYDKILGMFLMSSLKLGNAWTGTFLNWLKLIRIHACSAVLGLLDNWRLLVGYSWRFLYRCLLTSAKFICEIWKKTWSYQFLRIWMLLI